MSSLLEMNFSSNNFGEFIQFKKRVKNTHNYFLNKREKDRKLFENLNKRLTAIELESI
jgi:hypothetical protein